MTCKVTQKSIGLRGGEETMAGEIERIWGAIENYDLQLKDKQMTIRAQTAQLRQAYLREMLLGQQPTAGEGLERGDQGQRQEQLGLALLLQRYVVIAL